MKTSPEYLHVRECILKDITRKKQTKPSHGGLECWTAGRLPMAHWGSAKPVIPRTRNVSRALTCQLAQAQLDIVKC